MFLFCSIPETASMDIPAAIDLNKTLLARVPSRGVLEFAEASPGGLMLSRHAAMSIF
jgi:hypothetical protein